MKTSGTSLPAPPWAGYAAATAAALACTALGLLMQDRFDLVNIAMVYLLAVVVIALYFSRGAAVFSAAASVLAFDVVFVPPAGMLTVHDAQYLLTFAIMLAVALAIATLKQRAQREEAARTALLLDAERERLRSTLLASISHDLRTPLAVIAGASSTLAERGERMPPGERTALARSVFVQAGDMAGRVEKILQMTRLELGDIRLQPDWCSLAEIAGSVLTRLGSRLERHRVVVDLPADLPLLRVDEVLIAQVLANLLDNAARHTPPDTLIRLGARRSNGRIEITIDDSGPGLDEREAIRVFDKFHQQHEQGAGMGLGLAICRAIVGLHGGDICAGRVPGGGARFSFTLPLEAPPPPPDADTSGYSGISA